MIRSTRTISRSTPQTAEQESRCDTPPALNLRVLFATGRRRILATYTLFCCENLLRLAQPFVLGLAINDLLDQSYRGVLILIGQHLTHMLIGSVRQMYDTRVFTRLYRDLASDLVARQQAAGIDVSRIAARSTLSRVYVDFFEQHIPLLIRASWSIIGAIAMLGFYDPQLLPWCLAIVPAALILNTVYGRKTFALSGHLHDQFEREVNTLRDGKPKEIRNHYHVLGRWQVRLSDAEAVNFILTELFVLGLMVAILVQYCLSSPVRAGDVFAVFRYLMLFITGLDAVPRLVHQVSRLRDIGQRCAPQ